MSFRQLLCLVSLFLCPYLSFSQTAEIKGTIQDTTAAPLSGASVVVLNAQDSLLEKFAISEANGDFIIKRLGKGEYILQVSFLGYQTYSQGISVSTDQDVGNIVLKPVIQDMDAITVEAERIPIEIDGDTIKYNADAFDTRPNANVEELLKKLPGMEVARDGSIKAQGEDVSKVLVNGKEFFGKDPKIATKNLPADIVDQVQVFDEQSETSRFTGVDDGEREKTINLSLKKDKSKGWFGNFEGGYGTENRYNGKANLNRFTDKMQFSTLGRLNNVNEQAFTIQDYFDLMGGMSAALSGGLMINPSELGISFNGDDRRQGFLTTGSLGSNLNYDFSEKSDLSINYFYNTFDKDEDRTVSRNSFLGEGQFFNTDETSFQNSVNNNHRLNARYKYKIDSTQNIQLRLNMGLNDRLVDRQRFQETFLNEQQFQNSSDQTNRITNDNYDWNANALYRKRFAKKGRSFVSNLNFGQKGADGLNLIEAANIFGSIADDLNQEQIVDNSQWNYDGRFTFTEPVGKGKYLAFNYRRRNYEERMDKDFFDIVAGQLVRNDFLSNQFISDYIFNQGGLALQWNAKKSKLRLSLAAQQARLIGDFLSEFPNVNRRFNNLLPGLNWNYEFNGSKSLTINYNTNVSEPTIQQLQPVVDNSNPLSIYVGNPNLKPAYNHNVRIQTTLFNQFSFTSFF
ncbi:MAG: TonB-dependent receptor, partial [Bacteroidota bacterium]